MGYYTYYTLYVKGIQSPEECKNIVGKICDPEINRLYYEDRFHAGEIEIYSDDICKWYDCTEDMRKLSSEFPHCAFMIDARGEESDDLWTEYYLNGKSEYCKGHIFFDEPTIVDWDHYVAPKENSASDDPDLSVWNTVYQNGTAPPEGNINA